MRRILDVIVKVLFPLALPNSRVWWWGIHRNHEMDNAHEALTRVCPLCHPELRRT